MKLARGSCPVAGLGTGDIESTSIVLDSLILFQIRRSETITANASLSNLHRSSHNWT
jgi:hypothetical protein